MKKIKFNYSIVKLLNCRKNNLTIQQSYNSFAFTLVELVIAMTIIALLAIIGLTVFTGVQRYARDAKRRSDIDSISHAFEDKYNDFSGVHYPPLTGTDFAGGQIPIDPISTQSYSGIGAFTNPAGDISFCVCAHLEMAGGNSNFDAPTGHCGTPASGSNATFYCIQNRR